MIGESIRMLAQHVNGVRQMFTVNSRIFWCADASLLTELDLTDGERKENLPALIDATARILGNGKE